jgi:hypothetical protein
MKLLNLKRKEIINILQHRKIKIQLYYDKTVLCDYKAVLCKLKMLLCRIKMLLCRMKMQLCKL